MTGVEIIQGDCRDVMANMEAGSVNLVIADPPYGARRPSARRSVDERFDEVDGNDLVHGEWLSDAYRVLADGGAVYVFVCWDRLEEWRAAMTEVGFRVRSCIVWDKEVHGLADLETCWAPQHEMVLFAAKGRHELRSPRPKDVIRSQRVSPQNLRHPYQKPLGIIAPLIRASTDAGDIVLDPFGGSGTTAVACQKSGRNCIIIESDPRYLPLIRRRVRDAATPLFPIGAAP